MQRSAAAPTPHAASAPFLSALFGGGGTNANTNKSQQSPAPASPTTPTSKPQRPPSSGEDVAGGSPREQKLVKDRKPSFGRKPSFIFSSSSASLSPKRTRRRADSAASNLNPTSTSTGPPADGIAVAAPQFPDPPPNNPLDKMLSRGAVTPITGFPGGMTGSGSMLGPASLGPGSEQTAIHQHIQETANKRISTLEYLRKAHEGRIYWFNTLLFDKPDLQRMPYFDARKLGRRATNYLLLGISLPAVIDLNSNNPVEFLRSLNTLLAEFDAFQQIHTETGIAATSLTRTRIPQMFRRAAAPVSKGRRSSSAAGRDGDLGLGYALEPVDSNTALATTTAGSTDPTAEPLAGGGTTSTAGGSVITFGDSEVDLLPGEEYTHLLTPTLPFDPDFFETFATLCDVLIDTYTRLLGLVPTPRECGGTVAELFAKADGKIRKLFIQGVVREFEECGRGGARGELASVGKVVLSGLM